MRNMPQLVCVLVGLVVLVTMASAAPKRATMRFHERDWSHHPRDHHHHSSSSSSSSSSLNTRDYAAGRRSYIPNCAKTATFIPYDGNSNSGGPGVELTNADSEERSFYFYENSCDDVPFQYISLPPQATQFVSLAPGFQGRITRGTDEFNLQGRSQWLGTWVELTVTPDGQAWGDVSLIRGCDGAVTMKALDGSEKRLGFEDWLLDGAPEDAYDTKESGVRVLRATGDVPLTAGEIKADDPHVVLLRQQASARDYLNSKIDFKDAYIDNHHGNPVAGSINGQFAVTFLKGRP